MIDETVAKIEAAIRQIRVADTENKKKLIRLLEQLKEELGREKRSDDLLRSLRDGLAESAIGFETSHPKLAPAINEISTLLASIGI